MGFIIDGTEPGTDPQITLDNAEGNSVVLHETSKRAISKITGLIGISGLRDSRRVRPQAHGGIDETRFENGRLITIEGATFSQVSQADCYAEFREIVAPMIETLDVAPALLKWREGSSGLELQRLVRLASEIDPPIEGGAAILQYQAQFYAEDPRAYSQSLTTVTGDVLSSATGGMTIPFTIPFTFATSGGGSAAVTNSGNRPTPGVFRIYGACQNPQLVLDGTDSRIVLVGSVAAGDYLEVGTDAQGARYVKLNGETSRMNFLSGSLTKWFELPAGNSTVRLFATDFDASARCDVLYRASYA